MSQHNKLKPNLVDPIINQKIIKTLNPPKEDYWEPTRNIFQTFYRDYIKPNILLVLFIIIILIILFYRYHVTQKERKKQPVKRSTPVTTNPDTQIAMDAYQLQKEYLLEPHIKKFSNRVEPASQLAYPMYPYQGGVLAPSGKRWKYSHIYNMDSFDQEYQRLSMMLKMYQQSSKRFISDQQVNIVGAYTYQPMNVPAITRFRQFISTTQQ